MLRWSVCGCFTRFVVADTEQALGREQGVCFRMVCDMHGSRPCNSVFAQQVRVIHYARICCLLLFIGCGADLPNSMLIPFLNGACFVVQF